MGRPLDDEEIGADSLVRPSGKQQRLETTKLMRDGSGRIKVGIRGLAQEIRRTSKVASSRKFPPQKAVTCCMMAR
jgi:hypothetical protein